MSCVAPCFEMALFGKKSLVVRCSMFTYRFILRSVVTVERFEEFSLHFSIALFVIRVNLLHP